MGILVDGVWHPGEQHHTERTGGRFERAPSRFRNWVTPDGSPGPGGEGGFPAAAGRYRLYVVTGCPWAHRTLLWRCLKGLESAIPVTRLVPEMTHDGWVFPAEPGAEPRAEVDPLYGHRRLYELYLHAEPRCNGRPTVPVLWDSERETIVSNESAEIIRMLNSAFDAFADNPGLDLYPEALRAEIDAVNAEVYEHVNNGVYRCGFATEQAAYDEALETLFNTLDALDDRLGRQRYLCGERPTEADWRLYPTLLRFDLVYHAFFKCNLRRIADYPNLSGYLRELYQAPGIRALVEPEDIKRMYYSVDHAWYGRPLIVPRGPSLELDAPHGRDRLAPAQAAMS